MDPITHKSTKRQKILWRYIHATLHIRDKCTLTTENPEEGKVKKTDQINDIVSNIKDLGTGRKEINMKITNSREI